MVVSLSLTNGGKKYTYETKFACKTTNPNLLVLHLQSNTIPEMFSMSNNMKDMVIECTSTPPLRCREFTKKNNPRQQSFYFVKKEIKIPKLGRIIYSVKLILNKYLTI